MQQQIVFFNRGIILRVLLILLGVFFANECFAAAGAAVSITTIQQNVGNTVKNVGKMIGDVALITGVGFILAAFFKFHQHKLNPTQVPLSQGVTLLVIGAGLAIFPTIITTATKGVFGQTASGGTVTQYL